MMASGLSSRPTPLQYFGNFLDVVAVNVFDAPAERFKTVAINFDVMAERRGFALAEAVRIHDGDQIIQFVHARERRGFPNRAFGDFAVAEQDVSVVIQFIQPRGERHADADAKPWPSEPVATSTNAQSRRWMTFEFATELAEFQKFAHRE